MIPAGNTGGNYVEVNDREQHVDLDEQPASTSRPLGAPPDAKFAVPAAADNSFLLCTRRKMRPITLIGLYMGVLLVVQAVLMILRLTLSGVDYYRLVRTHAIINMEFAMAIGSIFLTRRITTAISNVLTQTNSSLLRPLSARSSICFADIMRALVYLFIVLAHIAFVFYYVWVSPEPHVLAILSLTAVALWLHALVFIVVAELVHFVFGAVHKRERLRKFLVFPFNWLAEQRDSLTLLAFGMAVLFVLGGVATTFAPPVITPVTIRLADVPEGMPHGGIRIALLSDIHIGPTVGKARIEEIVKMTNELEPDVVAISGDLADGFLLNLEEAAQPLCQLTPKHGIYFATGNHEYMHGNVDEWFAFLRGCGIVVLHNENRRIPLPENATLCMAGADDITAAKSNFPGHAMDAAKAVKGCLPSDVVVLLAHQPNAAAKVLKAPEGKLTDLILSGHTHAGQMYFFAPVVYLANAFTRGLYKDRFTDTYIYVSAGVNYFGPPVKMFGTCEIIDITLVPLPAVQ